MSSEDESNQDDASHWNLGSEAPKRKQPPLNHTIDGVTRHNRRKVKSSIELICPLCQLTLRTGDLEAHFTLEWKKVCRSRAFTASRSTRRVQGDPTQEASGAFSGGPLPTTPTESASPKHGRDFTSFQQVRVNRLLRAQSRRWQVEAMGPEVVCPVCAEGVAAASQADLEAHVDACLRKQEAGNEVSDGDEDVEGEAVEWCGVRRIRLTSLVSSRAQLDAMGTVVEGGDEDANVDVCGLEEDDDPFGPSQYAQRDLDFIAAEETSHPGEEDAPGSPYDNSEEAPGNTSMEDPISNLEDLAGPSASKESKFAAPSGPLVEALQFKLQELEDQGSFICHICHGPYDTPVTSTVCWHVHCERCWLQSLSSQKLCPQCKVIVLPTELRRVYL